MHTHVPLSLTFSMMDAIVLVAALFAVAFFVAWLLRPDLRAWIERPKYRFQADVTDYDRMQRGSSSEGIGGGKDGV